MNVNQISLGENQSYQVLVHPTVVLNILESFHRKNNKRKIQGSIFGYIYPTYILVTNCYVVPQNPQNKEELVNQEYHKQMLEHYNKMFSNEQLLGGFVTETDQLQDDLVYLTQFYSDPQSSNFISQINLQIPIVLSLDPLLKLNTFNLQVHQQNTVYEDCHDIFGLFIFQKLYVQIQFNEERVQEIQTLLQNTENPTKECFNQKKTQQIFSQLYTNLTKIQRKCNEKDSLKNNQIGLEVQQLLHNFNTNNINETKEKQEISLLLVFLSNIARTQNAIANKLQSME